MQRLVTPVAEDDDMPRRPAYRLPSYRACRYPGCVQGDCDLSKPDEPCWGDSTTSGDFLDECLLHSCEGHSWNFWIPYRPSTRPEDQTP
jgi:hypothetical protein